MSKDTTPFVAPVRYPSPPKNIGYEVPKTRPTATRTVFPWEKHQRTPSREFPDVELDPEPAVIEPSSTHSGEVAADSSKPAETPTTPIVTITPADPWSSFSLSNAWDEVPEINRYVEGIQKQQRRRSSTDDADVPKQSDSPATRKADTKTKGLRLTDFPTIAERPSLPVTPAPIHRPSFWGDERDSAGTEDGTSSTIQQLPAASGVPLQSQWVRCNANQQKHKCTNSLFVRTHPSSLKD